MRLVKTLLLGFFVVTSPAWADEGHHDDLLNKVTISLNAEQWVTSKSALVTVGVNAAVNGGGLDKIQDEILKKLAEISAGEWHIVSFDRSLDQSGLEKVIISAQARLPSGALSNLRDRTKSISKPGETFTLDNVAFTPSDDDLRQANIDLRMNIYMQAKDELDRLNKMYPDQHYYVHDVDFVRNLIMPPPMAPIPMMGNYMAMRANTNASSSSSLAVGNKLTLNATIVLAAPPADHNLLKTIT